MQIMEAKETRQSRAQMRVPQDIPTSETIAFIESHTKLDGRRVLEVGCGTGFLASRLASRGAIVTGIDLIEDNVAEAKARGVDARVADFLQFSEGRFDIVLFGRSLHHIHPLKDAIKKAFETVTANGIVLADEFDIGSVDEATASWRYETELLLRTAGVITTPHKEDCAAAVLNPIAVWNQKHERHHLSTGAEMLTGIKAVFSSVSMEQTAYMYRYMVDAMPDHEDSTKLAEALLAWEKRMIAKNSVKSVGLRFKASAG